MDRKACPHCNEFLPLDSFGTRMMDGVERPQSWCKDCRAGSSGPFEITRNAPPMNILLKNCTLKNPPKEFTKQFFYLDGKKTRSSGSEIDRQRQKVYDAENASNIIEDLGQYADDEEMVWALHDMVNSRWFKNRFGDKASRHLIIDSKKMAAKRGYQKGNRIVLNRQRWKKTLIHELAHYITPYPHGAHGPLYCALYLMLLDKFAGPEYAERLRCSFEEHGAQYKPYPKLRVRTPRGES